MDLGGGREASAPTTSILPPPPRSPGSTPDQYGHTNPPHPASTDLPARKRSKVGKMECEGTRKWEIKNDIYPHQINMATPTPSPPTDPMQWREKLTEEKKEGKTRVKSNKMKYDSLHQINASTPTHAQRINQYTALPWKRTGKKIEVLK